MNDEREDRELFAAYEVAYAESANAYSAVLGRKRGMEAELASIATRLKSQVSYMTRLPPADYRALCNRQTLLKKRLAEIEAEAAPLKAKMRELSALCNAQRAKIGWDGQQQHAPVIPPSTIRREIVAIRDRWLGFAEDQTRVNSMRIIAAQFARELTDVLADAGSISPTERNHPG